MSSEIKVDTISENTSANGVTIDGVKLKDNVVTVQGTSTTGGIIEIENTDTSGANGDFIGKINFKGNDSSSGASGTRAAIEAKVVSNFGSTELHFKTAGSGASATDAMVIDSAGHVTKPLQPAFLGSVTSTQSNVASGDHILFPTIRSIDRNGDYASSIFTAPVDGLYQFNIHVSVTQLDRTATFNRIQLETSNQTYSFDIRPAQLYDSAPSYHAFDGSILADMDAGDTAFVRWSQSGGSSTADVFDSSYFSGFLVC